MFPSHHGVDHDDMDDIYEEMAYRIKTGITTTEDTRDCPYYLLPFQLQQGSTSLGVTGSEPDSGAQSPMFYYPEQAYEIPDNWKLDNNDDMTEDGKSEMHDTYVHNDDDIHGPCNCRYSTMADARAQGLQACISALHTDYNYRFQWHERDFLWDEVVKARVRAGLQFLNGRSGLRKVVRVDDAPDRSDQRMIDERQLIPIPIPGPILDSSHLDAHRVHCFISRSVTHCAFCDMQFDQKSVLAGLRHIDECEGTCTEPRDGDKHHDNDAYGYECGSEDEMPYDKASTSIPQDPSASSTPDLTSDDGRR
ncbi:hypothetical protein CC78DRAFT_583805 [Lojkania enalia]|uniref:Uncharacterized protein n=1 Tax=Lojkania enalia TaxID=147567 RepID=A0A9P4K2F6_9PLEO|nr:hypothetical protein CC78DRAFT_583805 [Didymosphaeria enalia]